MPNLGVPAAVLAAGATHAVPSTLGYAGAFVGRWPSASRSTSQAARACEVMAPTGAVERIRGGGAHPGSEARPAPVGERPADAEHADEPDRGGDGKADDEPAYEDGRVLAHPPGVSEQLAPAREERGGERDARGPAGEASPRRHQLDVASGGTYHPPVRASRWRPDTGETQCRARHPRTLVAIGRLVH